MVLLTVFGHSGRLVAQTKMQDDGTAILPDEVVADLSSMQSWTCKQSTTTPPDPLLITQEVKH